MRSLGFAVHILSIRMALVWRQGIDAGDRGQRPLSIKSGVFRLEAPTIRVISLDGTQPKRVRQGP